MFTGYVLKILFKSFEAGHFKECALNDTKCSLRSELPRY